MFIVKTSFWEYQNKGTQHEQRHEQFYPTQNGPFETRGSAEAFARNMAAQANICRVSIEEEEAE
jgi:hypothetical protein